MASSRWLGHAVALAAAVVLAGCSIDAAGPRLVNPDESAGAGLRFWGTQVGATHIDRGTIRLCLDQPGRVTITRVTFENGDGLSVSAFATARASDAVAFWTEDPQELGDGGWDLSRRFVDTACPSYDDGHEVHGELTWIGLELRKDEPGAAGGITVQFHYTNGEGEYMTPVRMFYVLCETRDQCEDWYEMHNPY